MVFELVCLRCKRFVKIYMPWMTIESFVKLVETQTGFEEHVWAGFTMMDKMDKGEVAPP